jgi:DNA-binding transcriptional LysR family regulator
VTRTQLRGFLAVLEHGSLGRAATALGVATPSLAQSLRTLEREVGAPLVHRLPGGTVATPAGTAFAPHARTVLRALSAPPASAEPAGVLDLVADPVLAVDPGGPLLAEFRRRFPDVRLQVQVPEAAGEVLEHLRDGRAELGLVYLPVPGSLHRTPLGTHDLVALLPPESDDAPDPVPDPVPAAALAGRDVVDVPGSTWRDALTAWAGEDARWRTAVETAHREAVVPLVLAGAGTAFVAGAATDWAAELGVRVRRLDPPLRQEFALVHRRGEVSGAARALLDLARRPGDVS